MFKLILVKCVKPVFFIAILSLLLRYHAKPYPGSPSNINWGMFLPASPHYMSFPMKNREIDLTEEGIKDASKKGSNQDVSTCLFHNSSNRFAVYILYY